MLEIKDLSVVFNEGTVNEKIALDNISLNIEDGDFITVIGSNGAGKSTLLNAILGLVPIKSGQIILDGEDITKKPSHKRAKDIGIVFQNPLLGTAPNMTIMENLALSNAKGKWSMFKNACNKKAREQIKEDLKKLDLDLENRLDANVGLLSGGQRQALTILMATKEQPKLLLLDEHTAALDPKTAQNILSLSDDIIKTKKISTIMITHNIKDALNYGNKLILMNQSKIIFTLNQEEKKEMTVEKIMSLFNNTLDDSQVLINK